MTTSSRVGGREALRACGPGHELAREAGVHVDETIADGEVIRSGDLEIEVIATPGIASTTLRCWSTEATA